MVDSVHNQLLMNVGALTCCAAHASCTGGYEGDPKRCREWDGDCNHCGVHFDPGNIRA